MRAQARLLAKKTRARLLSAVRVIPRAVTPLPSPLLILEEGGYLQLESGGFLLLEGTTSNGVTWASLTEPWSSYTDVTWADWT